MNEKIEIGDVVRLKHSTLEMTVTYLDTVKENTYATCYWFNKELLAQSIEVNVLSLVKSR